MCDVKQAIELIFKKLQDNEQNIYADLDKNSFNIHSRKFEFSGVGMWMFVEPKNMVKVIYSSKVTQSTLQEALALIENLSRNPKETLLNLEIRAGVHLGLESFYFRPPISTFPLHCTRSDEKQKKRPKQQEPKQQEPQGPKEYVKTPCTICGRSVSRPLNQTFTCKKCLPYKE